MKTSFDRALSIANGIANRMKSHLNVLSYDPDFDEWTAYYGSDEEGGTSYVKIEDRVHFDRHLEDFNDNWTKLEEASKDEL